MEEFSSPQSDLFDEYDEYEDDQEHRQDPPKPSNAVNIFIGDCKKVGSDWEFDIEVTINDNQYNVKRTYKEIQWLYRYFSKNTTLGGYILPPLPESPAELPDLPATAIIGSAGEGMFGGLSRRHCLRVELLLQDLASHRYFGENKILHDYLVEQDVSTADKVGGSVWASLTKVVSDYQLSNVQDTDERFTFFLKYVTENIAHLEKNYESFSGLVIQWQKLAMHCMYVRDELQDLASVEKRCHYGIPRIVSEMTEMMLDLSIGESLSSLDAAISFAATLQHQGFYFAQCKAMLLRRLALLQTFQSAVTQLDRAKPEKRESAEKLKEKAESEFQEVSEVANTEVTMFENQYYSRLKSSLMSYTESQVAHSKRFLESLARIRDNLLEL